MAKKRELIKLNPADERCIRRLALVPGEPALVDVWRSSAAYQRTEPSHVWRPGQGDHEAK